MGADFLKIISEAKMMEISSTKERRLVGIWLVAAYFFAKAGVVAVLAIKTTQTQTDGSNPLQALRELLPIVQRLNAGANVSVVIAYALAAFGFIVGICILLRQKWAAVYIIVYHGFALLWFVAATLGLKMIGIDSSAEVLSSVYFKLEAVSSLLMIGYLLRPRVLRSFGFS